MKTEALLLLVFIVWILSLAIVVCFLNIFIDEEKKGKGEFFKFIKSGVLNGNLSSVLILIAMMVGSIIGLIWSSITISSMSENISVINSLIFTFVFISVAIYMLRKFNKP